MRLYALLFALAVCRTRAATIPVEADKPQSVQPVDDKQPIGQNTEGILRDAADSIPVAIVEEPAPALKLDENSNDYIPSDDEPTPVIKRLEIDLNNPGPPQRQEHDTQNPEFYGRDYFVADIKQKLLDTENVFKKSVSEVNESFENWVPDSERVSAIQNDIKEMQEKFLAKLSDLNQSLQSYLNPQSTKSVITDPDTISNLKEVENRLKDLETNFKVGVQTLSEGVKALETAKADGDGSSAAEKPSETGSPSPAPSNPTNEQSQNQNPFSQVFQFFSDAIGNAMNQVQNTLSSFTNQNNQQSSTAAPPSGAQSDETPPTSNPPTFWENFQTQLSQIFTFGQNNQQSQTTQAPQTNPIIQAISSNQFFSNVLNTFRPSTTAATPTVAADNPQNNQPTKTSEPQVAPAKAEEKPQSSKPEASEPPKNPTTVTQTGPIRQIIQNNPIVKGIAQRIQSITNPEKPREKEPVKVPESVKSEDSGNNKEPVPVIKGYHGGNYQGGNNQGNNNDIDGIAAKSVPTVEKIEEVPPQSENEKEAELVKEEEEKEIVLPDKTE